MRLTRHIFKVVLRDPVVWVAALLLSAVAFMPLTPMGTIGFGTPFDEFNDVTWLAQSDRDLLEDPSFIKSASSTQVELQREATEAIERARDASDRSDYYVALAEYVHTRHELYSIGALSGPSRYSIEAEDRYYAALSQLRDPQTYSWSSDMPGTLFLCVLMSNTSLVPMLLSVTLLGFLCGVAFRRPKLLGNVAGIGAGRVSGAWIVVFLSGFALSFLAMLPAAVAASVMNGIGDLAYPIIFTKDGAVVSLTVADLLIRLLLLRAATCCFIASMIVGVRELTKNNWAALVVAGLYAALAFAQGDAGASGSIDAGFAILLPSSYLSLGDVAGKYNLYFEQQLVGVRGATCATGLACLVGWSAVFLGAGALSNCARCRRSARCEEGVPCLS